MGRRVLTALMAIVVWCPAQVFADDTVDGRFGPGALYRLVRPTNWNGSLVLYAHGFVSKSAPVVLPPEADVLASFLVPQGFALAFSSFSENGWVVKDGAQRTHQLLGIFTSKFGAPARVYIGGASMGSLIAIKLVEQYPGAFVGALPACAVAGGSRLQFDYLSHTRALFDVFFPGVLPGNAGEVPPGIDLVAAILQPAAAALLGNPLAAAAIASIDQTPIPFSSPTELVESIVTALVGHAGSFNDLVPELHGKAYFDNKAVHYTGALPPQTLALINATVGRFDASPAPLNYLSHYYDPSGALPVPMLTLSMALDPVVPGIHRAEYADRVAAAGRSALLVQRAVNRYGHCQFTPAELATAFADLVAWVQFGIKPTP